MESLLKQLVCSILLFEIVQSECHIGWIHFEQSCYLFSEQSVNWYSAASSCREHNSRLAEIESTSEAQYLSQHARKLGHSYWLGGRDDVVEGQWEWSSGIQINEVTDWAPGEPNNDGDQDCLQITSGNNYKWDDAQCDARLFFICKQG